MANEEMDLDLELDDLDLEGAEVEELDDVEADIVEAEEAPKKAKKAKKVKEPKGEGLESTRALAEDEVGASYIADLVGINAHDLRNFLRKYYRDMEVDKSKRYIWKVGDPKIQEIVDHFNQVRSAPRTKKAKEVVETEE
jgi:hypothetical protein